MIRVLLKQMRLSAY
jgi:hypothetical protein